MALILASAHEDRLARGQRRPVFLHHRPLDFSGPYFCAMDAGLPRVGTVLRDQGSGAALRVLSRFRWPGTAGRPTQEGFWAEAVEDLVLSPTGLAMDASREGAALAWITLSDKGYAGVRDDTAGPLIAELVGKTLPLGLVQGFLLPDEPDRLRALLLDLALEQQFDLIVTTGGTGVGPRDQTPETCLSVLERRLPGMETAMLMAALQKTPHAVISRAVAGTLGPSLVINLPGSPKAVAENLAALLPALAHTLAKLQGDPSDCAG